MACANAVGAGNRCLGNTGSYAGGTVTASGTAGNPITITEGVGQTVTMTGNLVLNNVDYVTIDGLTFTDASVTATDATCSTMASFIVIRNSTFTNAVDDSMIALCADDVLIESNTGSGTETGDFANVYGSRIVLRNNTFTNALNADSGIHIDFFQSNCFGNGLTIASNYLLLENNVVESNTDGNSHFYLNNLTSGACPTTHATNIITRYNRIKNLGSAFLFDVNVDKHKAYNNTVIDMLNAAGYTIGWNTGNSCTSCTLLNNLFKDAIGATSTAAMYFLKTGDSTSSGNYNLACGRLGTLCPNSVTWAVGQIGGEANGVRNSDPLLSGYVPASNSPAVNAGGPLTTVHADDTSAGADLIVADASFFQPGWAGVSADGIRIGTTTTATIASINYTTNTLTLTTSPARSDGDAVYLNTDSDGTDVLDGTTAPDIGAVEYVAGDVTSPVTTITGPTSDATYATGTTPLTVSGTCTDANGCTAVTWVNDRGGSGTATGTSDWSFNTTLASGANVITVTGADAVGNNTGTAIDVITVTYTPAAGGSTFPRGVIPFRPGGQE